MGVDGALGMKELKEAGAFTIAQDPWSAVSVGMPGEAVALGGVNLVCSLEDINQILAQLMLKARETPRSLAS
jgi:two-component system chemotaxis response regulator CheB